MSIESIQAQQQAMSLDEIFGVSKKQEAQEVKNAGVFSWQADKVSFSAEAVSKAYENSGTQEEAEDESGLSNMAQGGGGGASAASDTSSIQKQITALQEQIAAIQGGSLPEDAKSAMISGLQAQISALQAQLGAA